MVPPALTGAMLGPDYVVPEEERAVREPESYDALVRRLSHQSVVKHFDAYADVPWDSEEYRLDPEDPRWELSADDNLGGTEWYRSQPQAVRARLNLHMNVSFARTGAQFENVLQRGLLELAMNLPNGSPEFRYAYHETIEEGQHSLMFQEFVTRSGLEAPGLSALDRFGSRGVIRTARSFPELFFVFVLGGEDPIDHAQRAYLRSGREIHPLLKRIMLIHVTEEARHLCFARHYLRRHVPALSPLRKRWLALRAPLILGAMHRMMLRPASHIVRRYAIPRAVIAEAYTRNAAHRAFTRESLAKVRDLCRELGLMTGAAAALWRRMGIADEPAAA